MSTSTTLPADPFAPFVPSDAERFDTRRLCHLLRRAAFGVTSKRMTDLRDKKSA